MLDQTQKTLTKVKQLLLRQQQQVEEQIQQIEKDDPVMIDLAVEASEPGTDSWQADVHARTMALKNDLSGTLRNIKRTLLKLNRGSYGKCEGCKKPIEPERLEALPTATLCVACTKKGNHKA